MPSKKTKAKAAEAKKTAIAEKRFNLENFIFLIIFAAFIFGALIGAGGVYFSRLAKEVPLPSPQKESHWLLLQRKSNVEYLYRGVPGDRAKSALVRKFTVKSGVAGEKPTPLPHLLGREFWRIIGKMETLDNPETAPYFITLDIPVSPEYPFGPSPYVECNGQCDWTIPGYFGLHGVNGDQSRLSNQNAGSSGCIRHKDEDIAYLYKILDPTKEEIRYYIEDN